MSFTPNRELTDLWILAGQSNMEGSAPLAGPQYPRDDGIWSFDMLYEWQPACDPLHHIAAAKDPCHRLIRLTRPTTDIAAFDAQGRLGRAGTPVCAGPGLSFAEELRKYMPERTIALLPCAHGGTLLEEWSPDFPGGPGETLYGSMLLRLAASGLKPKGMLWYQGESDATPELCANYAERFGRFVAAVRRDTGVADLPIYTVQLARVQNHAYQAEYWEMVREQQRLAADPARGIYMTSAIDGELSDLIHIDAPAQRMLGRRLAHLALRHSYGCDQFATGIGLDDVRFEVFWRTPIARAVRVNILFKGVMGRLVSEGRPGGLGAKLDPVQTTENGWYKVELNADGPGTLRAESHVVEGTRRLGIIYGPGKDPYCNITDEANQPLPCFGPIWCEIPG